MLLYENISENSSKDFVLKELFVRSILLTKLMKDSLSLLEVKCNSFIILSLIIFSVEKLFSFKSILLFIISKSFKEKSSEFKDILPPIF